MLRKFQSWTQSQLGEKIGQATTTISGWESGAHEPSISQVQRLAEIFDIHIAYFFDERLTPTEGYEIKGNLENAELLAKLPTEVGDYFVHALREMYKLYVARKDSKLMNFEVRPRPTVKNAPAAYLKFLQSLGLRKIERE